jgi:predicted permease
MPDHPNWTPEIERRLASLSLPPEREAEIVDELAAHLTDEYGRLLAAGASEQEAAEIALQELDAPPLSLEMQAVKPPPPPAPVAFGTPARSLSADLWRDLRYAVRTLLRTPGFTLLAVVSLALGIGGNASMFRVVSAALIRPLPYPDADRLVEAANSGYFPPGGLADLQRASRTMEVAGYQPALDLNLTGQGDPWRLRGAAVSANLFHVLGTSVQLGRAFEPGDDQPGRDNLVILSHQLWQDRFAADPAIVGRVLTLGNVPRTVMAIARRGFAFPDADTRFWIPLHLDPRDPTAYWAYGFMPVIARLRPGATLTQAQREIASLSIAMLRLFPFAMGPDWAARMTVIPLREFLTSGFRLRLLVLQCAVGLVLLIACANVAGLLLARAASRQKEIALRVALGASRSRIVRQLLTESLVLATAGGALGLGLAFAADSVLRRALPSALNSLTPESGWPMLWSATFLSLLTGVAFGLVPALIASRHDLTLAIKTGGQRAAGVAPARLRSALIVGEVALAVVLTISAGLLMRSLWKLAMVDPGFQPEHLLALRVSPSRALCRERAACIALYDELLRRTRDLPGVQDAAAANTLPLAAGVPATTVDVEGLPYAPGERTAPMFWTGAITPDYFRLMGIRILQGRPLTVADGPQAASVIVVGAATARRYWPGQNPIGKHVRLVWETRWRTVVGVAADVRQFDLAGRAPDHIQGAMYMPYAQAQDSDRELPSAMQLIVRAGAAPDSVVNGVRDLVRKLNPNVPVDEVRTMVAVVDGATDQPRSMMWLFVAFAAVALVLAAIGEYGVVSWSVAQRTFEIGVRVALGAGRRSIFGLVLGQSLCLVIAGLALGLAASLAVTRLLASFLYGTGAADPLTLACVSALLVSIALLAGYVPARKAAAIDPLRALRTE